MQIVSFMNMKGGVAKTTLAVNIAYALGFEHHKKVLLVDGDPQFNATTYLLEDKVYLAHLNDPKKGTLRDIFIPKKPGPINTVVGTAKPINKSKMPLHDCTLKIFDRGTGRGKLDLLPSTLALVELEHSSRQTENKLKAYLHEKAKGYDYVIIDCPPTISFFTQAAILASDKYIVPIRPDPLSVIGLPLLERYISEFTDDAGMKIEQVGLVFTMVRNPAPRAMKELMDDLRRNRKGAVFADWLSLSTDVAESVTAHSPAFLFRKTPQKIKLQMVGIAQEFLNRTGG
ncbi:ParA family protein [Bradyrhizobium jicamae]|uniref:ParA family protein n=1 Tax=Bradyrhizobium jicamae TaxID=280332 RepID=UPI001BA56872|nr:ParA family protein [Bradyrhizobium jicamae]MBR0757478.1 ParA family protein [Bradyrhizobium jicamae]